MKFKKSIQFEQNLYNLINTCGLSVDTAFYILKSVYLDFQKTLYECAKNEQNSKEEEKINYEISDEEIKNIEKTFEEIEGENGDAESNDTNA